MRILCLALFFMTTFLQSSIVFGKDVTTDMLSISGTLNFKWNKKHYPHVNPDAPKGGSLRLHTTGSYDSLNPHIARGISVAGLDLVYETLGVSLPDNRLSEVHGLIAEKFSVAKDMSYITFHINPKARFHDGKPITAEDVAFSFSVLMEKGAPYYKQYYGSVDRVEVLSPLEVRFTFKVKNNKELPFILSQLPVFPKHYWQDKDFSKPTLTPPLGSGPYRIKKLDPGSSIEFERVEDYWAKDLPSAKGRNNFDTVTFEYYRDGTVAREAFKAGAFDVFFENIAKDWATAYTGKAVEQSHILREEVPTNSPQGLVGLFFNTRRPIFSDIKVRSAIGRLFDFEWSNRTLFYNSYLRSYSYFTNSELASVGLPTEEEKAVLLPYKDQLPEHILTEEFLLPTTKGDGNIREQMQLAFQELQTAGWTLKDGVMRNTKGEKLEFTLLLDGKLFERVSLPFRENLARLGITMHVTIVDPTQYVNRVREFDYDIIFAGILQSNSPGNEQRSFFGTEAADTKGSQNYSGVKSPVVDALIERIIGSQTREELISNTKAMDRVLLWGHYVIPGWYLAKDRVAYWNKFNKSAIAPENGVDLLSWWVDQEAEKKLQNSKTGYGKQ